MPPTTYNLTGMHCAGCETKIRSALLAVPGVTAANPHAPSETVDIATDRPVDHAALASAVAKAGDYELGDPVSAPPREPGTLERGDEPHSDPNRRTADAMAAPATGSAKGYRALAVLVAYIAGASLLAQLPRPTLEGVMANFMGGFFLAFSFFKFLDLKGFASGFARYDLIAGAWKPWAYLYAFVELLLGIAYVTRFWPVPTHIVTLIVMTIGAAGVIRSLLRKDRIRCACLGTVIDLPLGTVTLIEDIGMALMAAGMLTLAWTA